VAGEAGLRRARLGAPGGGLLAPPLHQEGHRRQAGEVDQLAAGSLLRDRAAAPTGLEVVGLKIFVPGITALGIVAPGLAALGGLCSVGALLVALGRRDRGHRLDPRAAVGLVRGGNSQRPRRSGGNRKLLKPWNSGHAREPVDILFQIIQ